MPWTYFDAAILALAMAALSTAAVVLRRGARDREAIKATDTYDLKDLRHARLCKRRGDTPRDTLIVLAHGWRGDNVQWISLLKQIGRDDAFAACDVRFFSYRGNPWQWAGLWSYGKVLSDVLELDSAAYAHVILVGFSAGGLIVRVAFLEGLTLGRGLWAQKVSRIVLLATPNRGFGGPDARFSHRIFARVVRLLCRGALRDMISGSDFVTRLRLEWVAAFSNSSSHRPPVVQLLGVNDEYVREQDSADVTSFAQAKVSTLDNAKHAQIVQYSGLGDDKYRRFKASCFAAIGNIPGLPRTAPRVPSAVLFQIHGIRDYGGWLEKFADTVRAERPDVRVVRPDYEYFSALGFVLPWVRSQRIAWFCDKYTNEVALLAGRDRSSEADAGGNPPELPFYFVGHSYGTYLLAESLKRFPQMRFKRVCFVGSVVPQDYRWDERILLKQVDRVRNDCQARDWPVAVLCKVLKEVLRFKDIGVSGFHGFSIGVPEVIQNKWVRGDHSAGLKNEHHRASIVRFLLDGDEKKPECIPEPRVLSRVSQWAAPIVLLLLASVAVGLYLFPVAIPAAAAIAFVVLIGLNYG